MERNERILCELLKYSGNNVCADCGSKNIEYAAYNIGIFICARCSGIHRSLGVHISKVKHLKLDRWDDYQIDRMKEVGNTKAKMKYEERVPPCYRVPKEDDPPVLVEQWIQAKYQREEFCHPERQKYTSGYYSGFLMKRGKEDSRYRSRKFILSEKDDTLSYFITEYKEPKLPKAVLRISELNVVLAPEKMNVHPYSLQITFLKDGTTRHIYVYHEKAEEITNWYMAIRCAKLHRLQVAYPSASESELANFLTEDFAREGWLWKTGPRISDGFKKRWFALDNRKLMYHDDPMDSNPKGEIFIGHSSDGYSLKMGVSTGVRDQGFSFMLATPERVFNLSAQSEVDRDLWIEVLERVIERPLTPQDIAVSNRLVRKRTNTNSMSIFSPR
ncbi:arf-GAP with dual PH domain-containing protein 1-like [Euwallacea fornicatus]|uniref:arf-GAP with dual PH domain-containing protein 1-like n=1 Tax=Euwallacea fornicatus TaxID=995702 RepID=UPI00338EF564